MADKESDKLLQSSSDDDWDNELDNLESDIPGFPDETGFSDKEDDSRDPTLGGHESIALSAVKAVGSGLSSAAIGAGTAIAKNIPGISNFISSGSNVLSEVSSIKNAAATQVQPIVNTTTRAVSKILKATKLPFGIGDKLSRKLDSLVDEKSSDDSDEILSREGQMANTISEIFSAQIEQNEEDRKERFAERILDNRIEEKRHSGLVAEVHGVKNYVGFQAAFTKSVFTAYLKKDLELQYKQLFVAEDTLKLFSNYVKMVEGRMDSIVHNTGLPEANKIYKTEIIGRNLKEKFLGGVSDKISNFTSGIIDNLKSNVFDTLGMAADAIGMYGDTAEMKLDLAGEKINPLAALLRSGLSSAGSMLSAPLMAMLPGDVRKFINVTGGNLSPLARNMVLDFKNQRGLFGLDTSLGQWLDDHYNGYDFFRDMIPDMKVDSVMTDGKYGISSLDNPGAITNKTVLTIEDIIPGYLALQTQYLETLATKQPSSLKKWDFKTSSFVNAEDLTDSLYNEAFSKDWLQLQQNKTSEKFTTIIRNTASSGETTHEELIKTKDEIADDIIRFLRNIALANIEANIDDEVIAALKEIARDDIDRKEIRKIVNENEYLKVGFADSNIKTIRAVARWLSDLLIIGGRYAEELTVNSNARAYINQLILSMGDDINKRINLVAKKARKLGDTDFINKVGSIKDGNIVRDYDKTAKLINNTSKTVKVQKDMIRNVEYTEEERVRHLEEAGIAKIGLAILRRIDKWTKGELGLEDKAKSGLNKFEALGRKAAENLKSDGFGDRVDELEGSNEYAGAVIGTIKNAGKQIAPVSKEAQALNNADAFAFDKEQSIKNLRNKVVKYVNNRNKLPPEYRNNDEIKQSIINDAQAYVAKQIDTRFKTNTSELSSTEEDAILEEAIVKAAKNKNITVKRWTNGAVADTAQKEADKPAKPGQKAEDKSADKTFAKGGVLEFFKKTAKEPVLPKVDTPVSKTTIVDGPVEVAKNHIAGEAGAEIIVPTNSSASAKAGVIKAANENLEPENAKVVSDVVRDDKKQPEKKFANGGVLEFYKNYEMHADGTVIESDNKDGKRPTEKSEVKSKSLNEYIHQFLNPKDKEKTIKEILLDQLNTLRSIDSKAVYIDQTTRSLLSQFISSSAGIISAIAHTGWDTVTGVAKFGWNRAVDLGSGLKKVGGWTRDAFGNFNLSDEAKTIGHRVRGSFVGTTRGLFKLDTDIYSKLDPEKLLVPGSAFKEGRVCKKDAKGEFVILKHMADIDGPVYWSNSTKNPEEKRLQVAISQEDIDAGLIDIHGDDLNGFFTKLGKASRFLLGIPLKATGFAGNLAFDAMKMTGKLISGSWDLLKKAGNALIKKKDPYEDVYTRRNGEFVRLLEGAGIKTKKYFYIDKSGSPVYLKSAYGIDDEVYEQSEDNKPRVVVTKDDLKVGLFDANGNKLTAFAGKSILGKIGMMGAAVVKGAGKLVGKALHSGARAIGAGLGMISDVFGGIGTIGQGLFKIFSESFNAFTGKFKELWISRKDLKELVGDRLIDIYDLLNERLVKPKSAVSGDKDGDGDRDNSYEDKKSNSEERKKKYEEKLAEANKKKELKKGGVAAAAAANASKKDKEDDGDGFGMDDAYFASEMLDKLKNSKIGKKIGKGWGAAKKFVKAKGGKLATTVAQKGGELLTKTGARAALSRVGTQVGVRLAAAGLTSGALGGLASSSLAAIGSAGAFLASNPVGWAVAAGLAVGAAYLYFKKSDRSQHWLTERLKLYGARVDDDKIRDAIQELEQTCFKKYIGRAMLEKDEFLKIIRTTFNKSIFQIPANASKLNQLAVDNNVDTTKDLEEYYYQWFTKRFFPIFKLYVDIVKEVDNEDWREFPNVDNLEEETNDKAFEIFKKYGSKFITDKQLELYQPSPVEFFKTVFPNLLRQKGILKDEKKQNDTKSATESPTDKGKKKLDKENKKNKFDDKDEQGKDKDDKESKRVNQEGWLGKWFGKNKQKKDTSSVNSRAAKSVNTSSKNTAAAAGAGAVVIGSPGWIHDYLNSEAGKKAVSKIKIGNSEQFGRKIWEHFKAKGWTDEGIAGMLGNLHKESGVEAVRKQAMNGNEYREDRAPERKVSKAYTALVDEDPSKFTNPLSTGYGVAQWTTKARKRALMDYAKSKGKSVGDEDVQIEFLDKELYEQYKPLVKRMSQSKDVAEAATLFLKQFERPADQGPREVSDRTTRAQSWLERLAKNEAQKRDEQTEVKTAGADVPAPTQTDSNETETSNNTAGSSDSGSTSTQITKNDLPEKKDTGVSTGKIEIPTPAPTPTVVTSTDAAYPGSKTETKQDTTKTASASPEIGRELTEETKTSNDLLKKMISVLTTIADNTEVEGSDTNKKESDSTKSDKPDRSTAELIKMLVQQNDESNTKLIEAITAAMQTVLAQQKQQPAIPRIPTASSNRSNSFPLNINKN